jgi:Rrf2 family protein
MFCISTKGHSATRILVLLASRGVERPLSKQTIAVEEGTSPGYVQQLMIPLQAAGLVRSYRGKQGGFTLGRSPGSITVADILRATEGEIRLAPCQAGDACNLSPTCPTRAVWMGAADLLHNFFQQTTIAELAKRGKDLSDTAGPIIDATVVPAGAKGVGVQT